MINQIQIFSAAKETELEEQMNRTLERIPEADVKQIRVWSAQDPDPESVSTYWRGMIQFVTTQD